MGQSVSLIGLWIQRIALSWLVYRITLSPLSLGFVDFIGQFPVFCLTLFTGVWLDRWDLRNVLIVTQWLAVAQALPLAALTLSGFVSYWHIVFLSAFLGVVNSFDRPAGEPHGRCGRTIRGSSRYFLHRQTHLRRWRMEV